MELFDLREHDREEVLQAVMDRGRQNISSPMTTGRCNFSVLLSKPQKANYFEIPSADSWVFIPDKETFIPDTPIIDNTEGCSFAFQPIVDLSPAKLFRGKRCCVHRTGNPRRLFCRADRGRYLSR
jgi:hypothetical protein